MSQKIIKTQVQDNSGNMIAYQTTADMVLYKHPYNNEPIPLDMMMGNFLSSIDDSAVTWTAKLDIPLAGFTQSKAPYTQTIEVEGITYDDNPIVDVLVGETIDRAAANLANWGCVTKITTGYNYIHVICMEDKPKDDIPIQIKVIGTKPYGGPVE